MRLTNRVRADEGFGRYYGQLRVWQNVRRTDLMWSKPDGEVYVDQFTTKADMVNVRSWSLLGDWDLG